jgi:hypothetical protein
MLRLIPHKYYKCIPLPIWGCPADLLIEGPLPHLEGAADRDRTHVILDEGCLPTQPQSPPLLHNIN